MKLIIKKYPLTISILIAIWYLCFFTPPKTELDNIKFMDKWVHIIMYTTFCTIFWIEYTRQYAIRKPASLLKITLAAMICPILMSGIIELLQAYCTNGRRNGDWLDFAANSLGVAFGTILGRLFLFFKK